MAESQADEDSLSIDVIHALLRSASREDDGWPERVARLLSRLFDRCSIYRPASTDGDEADLHIRADNGLALITLTASRKRASCWSLTSISLSTPLHHTISVLGYGIEGVLHLQERGSGVQEVTDEHA